MRYRVRRRFRKDQSVESAVDDIAERTGHHQRQTDDNPLRRILPAAEQMMHQPADETYHDDAEYAEQQFSPVESPFRGDVHAESRAVVLDKP